MVKKSFLIFLTTIMLFSFLSRMIAYQNYSDKSLIHDQTGEYQIVADTGALNTPSLQRLRKNTDINAVLKHVKWFCSVRINYLIMDKQFPVLYDNPIDLRKMISHLIPVYFNGSKYKGHNLLVRNI